MNKATQKNQKQLQRKIGNHQHKYSEVSQRSRAHRFHNPAAEFETERFVKKKNREIEKRPNQKEVRTIRKGISTIRER